MYNKINQIFKQDKIFFWLMLIFTIFHFMIKPGGDDLGRISSYSAMPYKEVLLDTWRFCERQPRYFTYFIVGTLCHLKYGFLIWRIADCIVLFIIMKSISYIFVNNKEINILVALLISMYPFSEMITAGALSTTVGYTWVLASALLSIALFKKADKDKLKWHEILLMIISIIYATGQEQLCIVLLFIFGFLCIYSFSNKNKYLFLFGCLAELITCVNIFVLFRGAINGGRSNEILYWRDFYSLTFIDKFEIAFSSTLDRVLYTNGIILLLTGLILFIIWKKSENKVYTFIGAVPFTICLVGSTDLGIFKNVHNVINTAVSDTVKYGTIQIDNYYNIGSYLQMFTLCLAGATILLGLFLVGNNFKEGLFAILFIVLGIMTRMMLMVTVNIYASSTRTYLFLWFSIICTTIYVVDNNYKNILGPWIKNKKVDRILNIIIPILAITTLINNMLACI